MHLDITMRVCCLVVCDGLHSLGREAMNDEMAINTWVTTGEGCKIFKIRLKGLSVGLFDTYAKHVDVVAGFASCVINTKITIFDKMVPGHSFGSR